MVEPRYRAVLFDADDTLLVTRKVKWRQHQHVAKTHYGIDLDEATLRLHWGKPFHELVAGLYANMGTEAEREANFLAHEHDFPKTYQPGALEMIHDLHARGVKLGIITSMILRGAMIDFQKLALPLDLFDILQGSEATEHHKPDPRVFDPALKRLAELGIDRSDIVYVGDDIRDYHAARDEGLGFIGVTQGLFTAADFQEAGAESVFDNLAGVHNFILGESS